MPKTIKIKGFAKLKRSITVRNALVITNQNDTVNKHIKDWFINCNFSNDH